MLGMSGTEQLPYIRESMSSGETNVLVELLYINYQLDSLSLTNHNYF